jgi:hypothetical protein
MRTFALTPHLLLILLTLLPVGALRALTVTVAHHPVDCTANLQAALDGPADTIIVPNVGAGWIPADSFSIAATSPSSSSPAWSSSPNSGPSPATPPA